MKITKARLKQIIKEELENVVEARQPRHKIKASNVKRARNILKDAGHGFALNDEGELQADEKSVKLLTLDGIGVQSLEDDLNEYSPYKTGARPDKPHKKPGETKDDGECADPKRARPTKEELEGTDTLSEGAREMEMLMSAVEAMAASRGPEVVAKLLREIADGLGQGKVSINEELTRQDKTDVKKMVQDELGKLLKKKDTKDQMGEIVKKIMKKLYKDLSLEHPYIIDRIKV